MTLTTDEREELELLRAEKRDNENPDVLLLQGLLNSYGEGEWDALSVQTPSGWVYLSKILDDLMGWRGIATFQYHVTDVPMSFHALEAELVKQAMGVVDVTFRHAYSDLTGYLWTTEGVEVGGHDVLAEIKSMMSAIYGKSYLALRVERQPRDTG